MPEPPRRTGPEALGAPGSLSEDDLRALGEAKQLLRRAVTTRRESRTPEQRAHDDAARFELLQRFFGDPTPGLCVAAYLSTGVEPSTLELVSWLRASGARVLLPKLGRHEDGTPRRDPDWADYTGPEQLRVGFAGIAEPTGAGLGAEALGAAQVIVCSALAGTTLGARLGTGGGWYDRALAYADPQASTMMLLNDDELIGELPLQPWDRVMDVIVTSSQVVSCLAAAPAPPSAPGSPSRE